MTLDCTVTAGEPPISYVWRNDTSAMVLSRSPMFVVREPGDYRCTASNLDEVMDTEVAVLFCEFIVCVCACACVCVCVCVCACMCVCIVYCLLHYGPLFFCLVCRLLDRLKKKEERPKSIQVHTSDFDYHKSCLSITGQD